MREASRRALFVVAVTLLAMLSVALSTPDILLPWAPFNTFGFDAAPDGRIADVIDGLPAQRAGLRPGDRIDTADASLHDRRFVGQLAVTPRATTVTYRVMRAGTARNVTLTSQARVRSIPDNVTDVLLILFDAAFTIIAAVVLLARPSPLTWAFFIFAIGASSAAISLQGLQNDAVVIALDFAGSVIGLASALAMIPFAMMFPRSQPGRFTRITIVALSGIFVAVCALNIATGYATATSSALFAPSLANVVVDLNSWLGVACYTVAVLAFIANYVHSTMPDRKRMQWVALGFMFGTGLLQSLNVLQGIVAISPPIWLLNLLQSFTIFVPVSVAYTILKHRVIDVRFFVSRALVYALITSVAITVLALLEFFIGRSIEATNVGLVVEVLGAVAIGFGIDRVHASIDRTVDRVVFRSVHRAEEHLNRVGAAAMFAQSATAIDRMVIEEAQRALDLERVRVVRDYDPDSSLALQLHAERGPIQRGDDLAIPMIVRHQLLGYMTFGPHRTGAAIDPNEREVLSLLVTRAAAAYDHAASEARTAENEQLRGELALEQAKNMQLREMLGG